MSANAFLTETGEPLLAPYAIEKVQGVQVGFIGMTLEGTKQIVSQQGVAGLDFADEVDTANRYAAELQARGVEASRRSSCSSTKAARRPARMPGTSTAAAASKARSSTSPNGTAAVTGPIDLGAFTAYLRTESPVTAPALDRITTTEEHAAG